MGRIVGSPGNIFGRRRTRITGIGRSPARRDKTKDAINTLSAISGGLKVFEQAANLGTLIGGGIDRAVRNKKRDAARKALEQDRATQQAQQKQVDAAVSEAGQALESMPRLQEPDTSPGGAVDAGTQQFLQSIGLTSPPGLSAPAGTLFSGELQATDLLERQQQLRTRPGAANVLATQSAPAPEQAAVDRQVEQMRVSDLGQAVPISQRMLEFDAPIYKSAEQQSLLDQQLATGVPLSAAQVADDAARRINLRDAPTPSPRERLTAGFLERLGAMGANDRARRALARSRYEQTMRGAGMPVAPAPRFVPELAPSVSPELTQPLRQPFQPTVDLSQLEDLSQLGDVGITSQRAIDTYDPAQLIAASGFAENEQQLQSLLRAAEREATPTTFADLLSGKSVKALQGDIIKQFGKNRKKPLTEEQRLKNLKLRKEISDMSGIESRRASAEKSRAQAAKVRKQIEELDAKIKKDKEKASKDKGYRRIRRGLNKKQRAIEDQYSKYLDQYAKANALKDPDAKKRRLDSLKSSVPLFVGDDGELVSPIVSESQFSRLLEAAGLKPKIIKAIITGRGYDSSNKRLSMMEFPSAATRAVDERVGETADTKAAEKEEEKKVRLRKADALEKIRNSRLKKLGDLQALENPSPEQKAEIKYLRSSTDNLEERIKLLEAEGVESEIYEVPNPAGQ